MCRPARTRPPTWRRFPRPMRSYGESDPPHHAVHRSPRRRNAGLEQEMWKKCTPVRTPGIPAIPGNREEMQKCGSISHRVKLQPDAQSLRSGARTRRAVPGHTHAYRPATPRYRSSPPLTPPQLGDGSAPRVEGTVLSPVSGESQRGGQEGWGTVGWPYRRPADHRRSCVGADSMSALYSPCGGPVSLPARRGPVATTPSTSSRGFPACPPHGE